MAKQTLWNKSFIFANLIQFGIFIGHFMLYSTIGIYTRSITSIEWYVGAAAGIFTLASLITRLFSGKLLGRINTSKVLIAGLSLSLLASIGYLLSVDVWILIVMRIINGLGYGLSSVAIATMISSMLPSERLLEGLGYSMMVSTICGALGPAISLNIIQDDPDRFKTVFFVSIGVAFFSVIIAIWFQRRLSPKSVKPNNKQSHKMELSIKITLATVVFSILTFLVAFSQSTVTACLNIYALDSNLGNMSLFFILFSIANIITRTFMNRILQAFSQRSIMILITIFLMVIYVGIFNAQQAKCIFIIAVPFGIVMGFYYPLLGAKIIKTMSQQYQGMSNTIYLAASDLAFAFGAVFWSGVAGALGSYRPIYLIAAVLAGVMLLIVLRYPSWLKKYRVQEELW